MDFHSSHHNNASASCTTTKATTTIHIERFNANTMHTWIQALYTRISDCGNSTHLSSTDRFSIKSKISHESNVYDQRTAKTFTFNDDDDEKMHDHIRKLFDIYSQKWDVDRGNFIRSFNGLLIILSQSTLRDFILEQQGKLYQLSLEEWFLISQIYLTMNVPNQQSISADIFSENLSSPKCGMIQCRDQSCRFCYERLDLTKRFEPAMHFSKSQIHRFVNHYQLNLNSNVTCTTSNVIYALTCPCHQYDFIGRCKVPFRDRMWHHRMNGCRIMSNFFIGQLVADRLQCERENNPIIKESHLKLYQHSMQCPIALKIFLKCHPNYWCFVPMTKEQAMMDDRMITATERHYYENYGLEHRTEEFSEFLREPTLVRWCLNNLPPTPINYQFSLRQKLEQLDFFQHRLDLYPSRFLDLYNVAIVMVYPESFSDEMRHITQALLIAHAEPQLNRTIYDKDNESIFSSIYWNKSWCQHLVHPRLQQSYCD